MLRTPLAFLLFCALLPAQTEEALDAARQTGAWLSSVAVKTKSGVRWPPEPARVGSRSDHVYSGSAGVILFLLELHAATDDPRWLELACRGADDLLARMDTLTKGPLGLYTGLAGIGFTFGEVAGAVKEASSEASKPSLDAAKYRAASARCVHTLMGRIQSRPHGAEWNGVNDIISGAAGIGLWLLQVPNRKSLAERAGTYLYHSRIDTTYGVAWTMRFGDKRKMPNFSHGTAGVAYFMAELHAKTKRADFREAALAGATHLVGIANREGGGFRVHHHAPAGEELFYLGWCHGPPGTARLFRRLDQLGINGDWKKLQTACGEAILKSGIPAQRTPGFWNNVGWCCGTAGVGDFLLAMHRWTGEDRWLIATDAFSKDLIARATRDAKGWRWNQAEHRVRPKLLQTQTGLMQGAAGVGMWFLRRHAQATGRSLRVRLPDEPK
ncbi:MAG: hypothetical protein CMJ83_21275 [Planctomycetes bacterium]|nr:hypothetical protein [Planctomycetota bacterium]